MNNSLDLTSINNNISKIIEETNDIFSKISYLSRYKEVTNKPLKVIDSEKMDYIVNKSEEINNKIYNFSKSTTQTSRKLMTLTMLNTADSTYEVLKQILAQIETKQQSLLENKYKIQQDILNLKKYKIIISKLKNKNKELKDELDIELNNIEIEKYLNKISRIKMRISNLMSYIEAAIKEIGYLIESYEEIKKNKNISDNWSEYDMEKEQVKDMIRGAFRNGIRDFLVHSKIGMGTVEWFEQLGISPLEAVKEITDYLNKSNIKMNNNDNIDYEYFYEFLNNMADKYSNNYIKVLKKLGIDTLISDRFTLSSKNKKEE